MMCREPWAVRAACAASNGTSSHDNPPSGAQKGFPGRVSPTCATQKAGTALDYGDVSAYVPAADVTFREGASESDEENADGWCDKGLPVRRSLLRVWDD